MFLSGRKIWIFVFLINKVETRYDRQATVLSEISSKKDEYDQIKKYDNKVLEKNNNLVNTKQNFKIKLSNNKAKKIYCYRPSVDLTCCYNDNANKSVLINKNYQKRALDFLHQLQNIDFQDKLKKNPDKMLKEHNLTPNEISFILFKLYHPKDHNFDKSIINSILQSSYLEFNKNDFVKFQKKFDNLVSEYKELEKLKNGVTEEQTEQINKKLREKREDMQSTPLMVLLDNLAFPVKNSINCFNIWNKSDYDLKSVLDYKSLSPAGLAYFLLCILKYFYFFRHSQKDSYCLSKKIDETKLTIINDPRFNLGDFLESNSQKSPFSFYKYQFELTFLSIFQNL